MDDSCLCGLEMRNLSERIVGGAPANKDFYPYFVYMIAWDPPEYNNKMECGGSLINTLYVLSAAHCILVSFS